MQTLRCGLLCNDSLLVEKEGRLTVQGDPTEGALISAAAKASLFMDKEQARFKRLDTIPFESHYQYMATLHADPQGGATLVYVKGSVEAVLERCTSALDSQGSAVALDASAIHAAVDAMAAKGLQSACLCTKELGERHAEDWP